MNAGKLIIYLFCISLLATAVCGVTPTDDLYINTNTVLTPGTYNLSDTAGNGVIIINASNVVLDCNGAEIIGLGNGYGIVGNGGLDVGLLMEATNNLNNPIPVLENMDLVINWTNFTQNVVIKNCRISNYENAINITAFRNLEISGNNLSGNKNGIYALFGYESRFHNNMIYNNTNGIFSISINTLLSNNTAYNNTGIGIINGGIGCNSSHNNVHGNSLGIASVGFYNKVFNNNVSGNGRSGNIKGGILAFGGNSTEIFDNIAESNNQSGIAMAQIADVKVYNNTANYNDYGISVGGFLQGGESYLLNISNNTANYNFKAGILLSDATFEKMLRASMTGKTAGAGHVVRDSYVVGNSLYNPAWYAYDLYIDDSTGGHVSGNVIRGNNFNGEGVYDNYPQNNDYCDGNHYATVPSAFASVFAIRNITMFTSQEGSFLNGTIDVCDLDLDNDVTCGWYDNGGLYEMNVTPNCTIVSNESIAYFWRNGTYLARFWAKDPQLNPTGVEKNWSIIVANVNRAPNITDVVINATEGSYLDGFINGSDPDGEFAPCSLISSTLPQLRVGYLCGLCSCNDDPCFVYDPENKTETCWPNADPLPSDSQVFYNVVVMKTDGLMNTTFQKDFEVQRAPYAPMIVNGSNEYNYFLYPERIESQKVRFNVSLNLSLTSNGDPNQDDTVTIFSLNLPRNAIFQPYPNNPALMNFTWKIPCDEVDIGPYIEDPPGSGNTYIIYTIDFQTNDSHGVYGPPASVGVKIWNYTACI